MTRSAPPRVVIVGGGFGGLYAARALSRAPVVVTLIDRRNHHLFQPLLYQVAAAALNPADIAVPIRRVLRRQANATVIMGEARRVDAARHRVVMADGAETPYDFLIVATGATHAYFGHDEWAPFAPGLKTIEDALLIRRRILLAFEAAEREADLQRRRDRLTFVVVGGGPTGVELAGALAEIGRHILRQDFRHIDPASARVLMIEAGPRILATFPPTLSDKARQALERLGCEVLTGAPVTAIDAEGVTVGGRRIASRNVLWAAGVAASPLGASLGVTLDKAGRVPVDGFLNLPGHPEIFIAGDLATLKQEDGRPVPGVAPAAMQMGRYAARTIVGDVRGKSRRPFHYRDEGSLATIGRAKAVAEFGRVLLSGFVAWMAWLVIHIFKLIGFRNRIVVLLEWLWLYLRYESGARLITGETTPTLTPPSDAR